ncbi:MAG: hypothetical protein PHY59_05670 [Methanobacterium sp.]|nr:hypothetical protein [Methanobacterium sp.]
MKRSRLNLFKTTSMSISVLGIIMILATITVFIYLGVAIIGNIITNDVGSGSSYDQLTALKSEYNTLEGQYSDMKKGVDSLGNPDIKTAYINAHLDLVKAKASIDDVESALASGKSKDEVKKRINTAQTQLNMAKTSISNVKGLM